MILTVTANPALDHTVQLDEPLAAGTVARTDDARFDAGGKGINVSKYLAALGTETAATGFLGGQFGEYIRGSLRDDAIESEFVDVEANTRLNTTVLTPAGEYKINHAGPHVDEAAVDALSGVVRRRDPETVVVSGSLPPGLDAGIIDRLAADDQWRLTVDVGGDLLREVDAPCALCKPNREELAAATGRPVGTVEECIEAVRTLRKRGYERVLASLGGDGAILASPEETLHAPALDTTVVDTVGAGDSLLAGVLAGFDRGYSDGDALGFGVAVAARVVAVRGARVPDLGTVDSDRARVTDRS